MQLHRVDADVKRILDSSTGGFHDDFEMRSQPFSRWSSRHSHVARQRSPRPVLESVRAIPPRAPRRRGGDDHHAVREQQPRAWRMPRQYPEGRRHGPKVPNVEFVPCRERNRKRGEMTSMGARRLSCRFTTAEPEASRVGDETLARRRRRP